MEHKQWHIIASKGNEDATIHAVGKIQPQGTGMLGDYGENQF